jgi:hypothetical protein
VAKVCAGIAVTTTEDNIMKLSPKSVLIYRTGTPPRSFSHSACISI